VRNKTWRQSTVIIYTFKRRAAKSPSFHPRERHYSETRENIIEAELDPGVNNSQSAEQLTDGQLDAYFYAAGWPVAAMVQLSATNGL